MKRLFALMLALCLVLCGCSSGSGETTAPTETTAAPTTEAPTETTAAPTTEAPTETTAAVEVFANPMTGEVVDEVYTSRPIAIMINNAKAALPHCGISAADMVYESCVEGGATRFMAIFTDPDSAGVIGSVRSARPPFISVAKSYGAIYSSARGAQSVLNMIDAAGLDYINGLASNKYFYRDTWRKNNLAFEHSLMVTGEGLKDYAEALGYDTVWEEGYDYGLNFEEAPFTMGESVEKVTAYFTTGGKSTTCIYDSEKGGYYLNQYGVDYVDGNTKELVIFENVLILKANRWVMSDAKKHIQMDLVGEGEGWILRDGQLAQIKWSREKEADPFVYTFADGSTVPLGVGSTYVAIISDAAGIAY